MASSRWGVWRARQLLGPPLACASHCAPTPFVASPASRPSAVACVVLAGQHPRAGAREPREHVGCEYDAGTHARFPRDQYGFGASPTSSMLSPIRSLHGHVAQRPAPYQPALGVSYDTSTAHAARCELRRKQIVAATQSPSPTRQDPAHAGPTATHGAAAKLGHLDAPHCCPSKTPWAVRSWMLTSAPDGRSVEASLRIRSVTLGVESRAWPCRNASDTSRSARTGRPMIEPEA